MKKRSFKESLGLTIRGILMGAADVIPGVSGGTIAFITGIYQELLSSISSINIESIKLILKGDPKGFWKAINGNFFFFLFLGIGISIISLASIISDIIGNPNETKEKVILWSFFLGLISASSIYIGKQIEKWNLKSIVGIFIGTGIAFYISVASPATGTDAHWYIFICGIIAICAMILPGISGSFILLLMGVYPTVLGSISNLLNGVKETNINLIIENGITLAVFATGCIIGLLSFARLVSFLFKKAPTITLAVLTGFLIGSLNKVWPWKNTLVFRNNSHGESVPYIQENLMPNEYMSINGDHYIVVAMVFALFGFAMVFGIEWLGKKMKK